MQRRFHLLGIALTVGFGSASTCLAQPVDAFDFGVVNAPSTPASVRQVLPLNSFGLFDLFGGDMLTVRWVRFEVATPIVPPLYLDFDTQLFTLNNINRAFGLTLAMYDAAGGLIAVDDQDAARPLFGDSIPAAGLSFGSTDFRLLPEYVMSRGQDGTLAAGTYWLALAAGSQLFTTAGPTGWDVTTDASYLLDFSDTDTYFLNIEMTVGNTTPPQNDRCQDALVVGEDPAPFTPVWIGGTLGATRDGQFPCLPNTAPQFDVRDLWFSYVPSRTGYASIYAGERGPRLVTAMDRYDAAQGCGSPSVECAFRDNHHVFGDGVRMFVPVTQGNPVLLAVSTVGGNTTGMQLSIELTPPPCPLSTPAGSMSESETACGENRNGGCESPAMTLDPIDIGVPVRGTLFSTPTLRDTDWFSFTVDQASTATLTFESQMPLSIVAYSMPDYLASRRCGGTGDFDYPVIELQESSYPVLCTARAGDFELPPGTYAIGLEPSLFDNLPCGTNYEQYWFRVDTQPLGAACPSCGADFNQDGGVDGADIESFFVQWQIGGTCGDVNLDGGVDGGDVETFILLWEEGGC
jgi:hypothetical protein